MSTIFRDHNGAPIGLFARASGVDHACGVCGGKADACWQGHESILVCYRCSLDALPALIADAMLARRRNAGFLIETQRRMDERFWRAAALALANDGLSQTEASVKTNTQAACANRNGNPPE
jgi:hypothetical protein